LTLSEFHGDKVPEYAILSHTWGSEEFLFSDVDKPEHRKKRGFSKVEGFCECAARDGFKWFWADTCCKDKSSSAELSESINSMYQWYKSAHTCYVYLEDLNPQTWEEDFEAARWWTRGWTLQELIAPLLVDFYDGSWIFFGKQEKS
jgi:hypothetical protein